MKSFINIFIICLTALTLQCCGKDEIEIESASKNNKYFLWVDGTGNFPTLSNNADSIRKYVAMAKNAGFRDLVVDVRPISGEVLYNSSIAPKLTEWKGFTRTATFDYLKAFVDAAKENGLNVYASINTFTGGHLFSPFWGEAEAGTRPSLAKQHPEWISQNYVWGGTSAKIESMWTFYKNGKDGKTAAFLNPVNKEAQAYMLSIINEIASNYDVKGVLLDRGRFDSLESDFSDVSRAAFEEYIGEKVNVWPDDVYKLTGANARVEGKWYKKWLEFRVSVIYNFFSQAQQKVKASNKEFAAYVGAWYSSYYNEGVNWASKTYDPSLTYSWATSDYKKYGYAELLNFIITGCYSGTTSGVDNYINQSKTAINGAIPIAAGLYMDDYLAIEKGTPGKGKTVFYDCLITARRGTKNIMIFDMVHLNQELYANGTSPKYWDEIMEILK